MRRGKASRVEFKSLSRGIVAKPWRDFNPRSAAV
jgi:hypothetical protein